MFDSFLLKVMGFCHLFLILGLGYFLFHFFKFKSSELFEYVKFKLFKLKWILWVFLESFDYNSNLEKYFLQLVNDFWNHRWNFRVEISLFKWQIFFIKVIAYKKLSLGVRSQPKPLHGTLFFYMVICVYSFFKR